MQEGPKITNDAEITASKFDSLNRMLTSEQSKTEELNKEIKNLKYVISIQQGRIQKLSNRSLSRPRSKVQTSE